MKSPHLAAILRSACGAAMLGWLAFAVQAQPAEPVMKNSQVTESALIDALTVEPPAGAASGATRGFRAATAANSAPKKPAGPGRANLLITFDSNSATIGGETQTVLDTLARALQSDALAGNTFRVEGHADARGEAENNLKLSQQRAEAVAQYLVSKHGILPERLQAEGKGSTEPLNKARIDAPENRRVTVVTIRN